MLTDEAARCLQELAAGRRPVKERLECLRDATQNDPATEAMSSLGYDPGTFFDERVEWFRRASYLCPRTSVTVSGRCEEALISSAELWRFYLPLAQVFYRKSRTKHKLRVLVGVAGPPGSGKSVFSALLAEVFNAATEDQDIRAAMCSLDGFHFTNDYLETHSVRSGAEEVPLSSRKGAPESFDVEAFLDALQGLESKPKVAMPRYDREIHDPVPNAVSIGPADRIAIVEGNYLLHGEGLWNRVAARLDLRLFLDIPIEAVRPRIIERHVRGGRERKDAIRHFKQVDKVNFGMCMSSAHRADLMLSRNSAQRIEGVSKARM